MPRSARTRTGTGRRSARHAAPAGARCTGGSPGRPRSLLVPDPRRYLLSSAQHRSIVQESRTMDGSSPRSRRRGARFSRRPRLVPEVLLLVGLFFIYRLGRLAITGHDDLAIANAWHIWDLER